MSDTDDILADVAAGPKSARNDLGSVDQQPIPDLIALKKLEDAGTAAQASSPKLLFNKLVPPGTV